MDFSQLGCYKAIAVAVF